MAAGPVDTAGAGCVSDPPRCPRHFLRRASGAGGGGTQRQDALEELAARGGKSKDLQF